MKSNYGTDATISLVERPSGCEEFLIVVMGVPSTSAEVDFLLYPPRYLGCPLVTDTAVLWKELMAAAEASGEIRELTQVQR
jgi:hypothetical protein